MVKKVSSLFLVGCLFLLAGCMGHNAGPQDYTKDAVPQLQADDSSALVCFYRESGFVGGGRTYFVFEDNTKIGTLGSGTWFVHRATPGDHTYWAEIESKALVSLSVEAGKEYYIVGGIGIGVMDARPELTLSNASYVKPRLQDADYMRLRTPEEVERYNEQQQREMTR